MGTEKTVFLVHTARRPVRDLLRRRDAGKQIPWMYLGRDILVSRRLDAEASSMGPRISIADDLMKAASELRQSYIDYIGALGARHPPLSWWMTALSERSPFSSDVLLHFCYLSLSMAHAREHDGDLVVFAESRPLLRSIGKNLGGMAGVRVMAVDSSLRARWDSALLRCSSIARIGYFTLASTGRVLLSRALALLKPRPGDVGTRERIAFLSWADARSFPEEGGFIDAYLGEMAAGLSRPGRDIVRIVQIIPTFPYFRAVRCLGGLEDRVRLWEELLSPLDPLRALFLARSRFPALGEIPPWNGLDVSDIVPGEHRRNRHSTAPVKACLAYLAGKRLGSRIGPRDVVYPFENHSWEKLFCLGLRESSPKTKLLGYAHATVPPLELSYSRSVEHEAGMPLPDVILVNGTRSRELLAGSGFDPGRIVVAGAFRYPGIQRAAGTPRDEPGHTILIATMVTFEESLELLSTCIRAFPGAGGPDIVVKCHPTLPFGSLAPYLPPLPRGMTVSGEPIGTLLTEAGVLVYGGTSTVVLEALAKGVPWIHVRSGLSLDLDIFAGTDLERSVSTPEELREEALRALGGTAAVPPAAGRILGEYFGPPRPEILEECL
jgi:hypothetical protein